MIYFLNLQPTNDSHVIDLYDRKWLQLKGCFETILVKNARIQYLDQHLWRAQQTNEEIFSLKYDYAALKEHLLSVCREHCSSQKLYKIKIIFSKKNIFYSLQEYQRHPPSSIHLVSKDVSSEFQYKLTNHKLCDYSHQLNLMASVAEAKVWDCVRTNGTEFLETTRSTIYFCRKGEVVTPKAGDLLPGIIRQILLTKEAVKESNIFIKSLGDFDGMLLSNSLIEIVPVDQLDGHKFLHSHLYLGDLQKSIFS